MRGALTLGVVLLAQLASLAESAALAGGLTFVPGGLNPGTAASAATVSFTSPTGISVGETVEITLPDLSTTHQTGFSVVATPTIVVTTPAAGGGADPTGSATATGRVITVTIGANAVAANAAFVFTISGVTNPSGITSGSTTAAVAGTMADTGSLTVSDITAGTLGTTSFATASATKTPGLIGDATVAFTTAGAVPIGARLC